MFKTHKINQSLIDDILILSQVSRREIFTAEFNLSDWVKAFLNTLQASQSDRQVHSVVQEGLKVRADPEY